jgi:enoyl-CoA hydratase
VNATPEPDQAVLTEATSEGVLVVTLNRPHARNAINAAVATGVAAAMERLDADDRLRVAIVTGAGGTFCAGFDLKAFLKGERASVPGRGFAGLVERPPDKPLIAAIEGWALAGGFEVALSCDLIVAAEGARMGLPEVKRGLIATGGGLLRLPSRIPYHHAMEIALSGEAITAGRANELGLVNRLVSDGEALPAARELASVLCQNAPLALRTTKSIVAEGSTWPAGERFARQQPLREMIMSSEDAREGASAFAEKRPPVWRGR